MLDTEGTVLASVDEARAEAIVVSGQMLKELGANFGATANGRSASRTKPARRFALSRFRLTAHRRDMPRYFFHMSVGPAYIHDYEGTVMANDAAARARAIEDILAVWKARVVLRQNPAECAVVVASVDRELFRVPFVEAPGVLGS